MISNGTDSWASLRSPSTTTGVAVASMAELRTIRNAAASAFRLIADRAAPRAFLSGRLREVSSSSYWSTSIGRFDFR